MKAVPTPVRGPGRRPVMETLLALSAPLMVLMALLVLGQRQGRERMQALPALAIGTGLAWIVVRVLGERPPRGR